jgi:benzoyl-CoA 2,3-dioxygenase component B
MFVGETGIARIIKRTLEVMKELGTDDPETLRKAGVIDLPTIQRYMNFWFSSALDLFGADQSSNAATYFATGLKGRPDEATYEDHVCTDTTTEIDVPENGGAGTIEVPTRNAMNEITRQAYIRDCEIGLKRWNRLISKAGFDIEMKLPSPRFRRQIGSWAGHYATPEGTPVSAEEWEARKFEWIPSEEDRAYVHSLMKQVTEPGKMAAWIAPPDRGINNLGVDYEYVRLA